MLHKQKRERKYCNNEELNGYLISRVEDIDQLWHIMRFHFIKLLLQNFLKNKWK